MAREVWAKWLSHIVTLVHIQKHEIGGFRNFFLFVFSRSLLAPVLFVTTIVQFDYFGRDPLRNRESWNIIKRNFELTVEREI